MTEIDGKDTKARRVYTLNGTDMGVAGLIFVVVLSLALIVVLTGVVPGALLLLGVDTMFAAGVWAGSLVGSAWRLFMTIGKQINA